MGSLCRTLAGAPWDRLKGFKDEVPLRSRAARRLLAVALGALRAAALLGRAGALRRFGL